MSDSQPPSAAEAPAFYDEMWRSYAHLDAVSPAAFHRRRLVVSLARQAASDARRVLDVGCGQGELLQALARALPGATISGADVSEQSIADSRRRNPGFDLFTLDLCDPSFESRHRERIGAFDLVVCSEVVEHVGDDARAVQRLRSLLAPGGRLIVTVPGGRMSRFDRAIGHHRHYRPAELDRVLRGAGLEVDRVLAWGFPFHSLYRTAVRLASAWSLPGGGGAAAGRGARGGGALGHAYSVLGRLLRPLFYLNASRWGEQILALARRPA
jgi:SAM-dependent methyltransferase